MRVIHQQQNKIADLEKQLAELQEKYDACQEARKLEAEFKNQEFMKHSQELVDMEQQLAEKDKEILDWKDGTMICIYEKMLAEKDKEIEELKKEKELDNIFWKQECDSLQEALKNSHNNVCEEIREKFKNKVLNTFTPNPTSGDYIALDIDDVYSYLDKLEKGETQC